MPRSIQVCVVVVGPHCVHDKRILVNPYIRLHQQAVTKSTVTRSHLIAQSGRELGFRVAPGRDDDP